MAHAYGMLPSFKTSVTYNIFFNFTLNICVRCEAALVGHGTLDMSDVRC